MCLKEKAGLVISLKYVNVLGNKTNCKSCHLAEKALNRTENGTSEANTIPPTIIYPTRQEYTVSTFTDEGYRQYFI